ncbi:MAG: CBS domain-containing protein [Betaproteobacteria bacterium]
MEIKDIMMRSVETIEPDELLSEAARKMASQNIGFLPVWQEDQLVGVITDRDIVVRAVACGFDPEQTIVEEIMTSMVVSLPENSDIEDASDLMESKHVRRLVVTDENDMPVGIVSMDKVALHLGVYALDNGLVRDPPEPHGDANADGRVGDRADIDAASPQTSSIP